MSTECIPSSSQDIPDDDGHDNDVVDDSIDDDMIETKRGNSISLHC